MSPTSLKYASRLQATPKPVPSPSPRSGRLHLYRGNTFVDRVLSVVIPKAGHALAAVQNWCCRNECCRNKLITPGGTLIPGC
jgi:hypothetical protein